MLHHVLYDERTDCYSVLTAMRVGDYLDLVREAHEKQGAIAGQRNVLATTTARRIRSRMVSDLSRGAVLPPLVIGAVVEQATFDALKAPPGPDGPSVLSIDKLRDLSIIDGMQRTAAMIEAGTTNPGVLDHEARVEFWLTLNVRSMVYRMLVLNTGQVPWTLERQIFVVYGPLLKDITENVPTLDKMITPEAPARRVAAAQYRTDTIVELYIAFSLRKTSIDTKEQVSDEFSRLDFVDNLDDQNFQEQFYLALKMLIDLDSAFSRFLSDSTEKWSRGRHVFDSQPARIGYIVALGVEILGRPGASRESEERVERSAALHAQQESLTSRLDSMSSTDLQDFLRLDVLREVLDRRVGQVGRYERAVFSDAFKVLVEERFDVANMEQCWRAN